MPPPPPTYLYTREPARNDFVGVYIPDAVNNAAKPKTVIVPDQKILNQKLVCFDQAGWPMIQGYIEQLRIIAQNKCSGSN